MCCIYLVTLSLIITATNIHVTINIVIIIHVTAISTNTASFLMYENSKVFFTKTKKLK